MMSRRRDVVSTESAQPVTHAPLQLRVLTFNIWGLHYLGSVRIRERLSYTVHELKKYDIVGLQEVWKHDDFRYLVDQLEDDLPHHHYLYSSVVGSGLCVFSRHPIMETQSHLFTVCGSMQYLLDGELFSGKGILLCRILTPAGPVNFYNTHLDPRNRDSQCFEVYQFVRRTRGENPVIMTGDYNTKPVQSAYNFLVTSLDLHDVFADEPTNTCDLTSNIYTKKHMTPKRIDFVFISDQKSRLTLKNRSLAINGVIPGKYFPYSDHEGVEATFLIEKGKGDGLGGRGELEEDLCSNLPRDKDAMASVLSQMAINLRSKQSCYELTPLVAVAHWVGVVFALLLVSFFMNSYVYHLLAPFGLGSITFVVMAVGGAMGVMWVVHTIVTRRNYLALEANLTELGTTLRFLQRTRQYESGSNEVDAM